MIVKMNNLFLEEAANEVNPKWEKMILRREPLYQIKICYLQLTDKFETKITTNKIVASGIRAISSLLKTPFCTAIGQILSIIEQFLVVNVLFYRNFRIAKDGKIIKKQ